jgi:hypothetical protein
LQVETVVLFPSFDRSVDVSFREHLGVLIKMELENDVTLEELGDVSPLDVTFSRTPDSERRLSGSTAQAPTSGMQFLHCTMAKTKWQQGCKFTVQKAV